MKKRTSKQCENDIPSERFPEERLVAAFRVAGEAFKKTKLTTQDINNTVKEVRKKAYRKRR
jgi:hypothetical protein